MGSSRPSKARQIQLVYEQWTFPLGRVSLEVLNVDSSTLRKQRDRWLADQWCGPAGLGRPKCLRQCSALVTSADPRTGKRAAPALRPRRRTGSKRGPDGGRDEPRGLDVNDDVLAESDGRRPTRRAAARPPADGGRKRDR